MLAVARSTAVLCALIDTVLDARSVAPEYFTGSEPAVGSAGYRLRGVLLHQVAQRRQARAAVGAAAQGLLKLPQALAGIAAAFGQRSLDARLTDVVAGADLAAGGW